MVVPPLFQPRPLHAHKHRHTSPGFPSTSLNFSTPGLLHAPVCWHTWSSPRPPHTHNTACCMHTNIATRRQASPPLDTHSRPPRAVACPSLLPRWNLQALTVRCRENQRVPERPAERK
eukprot:156410-Chlamydomonas_euryale.AAC.10